MDSFHNAKCEDKDKGKGCKAYSLRYSYTLQKEKKRKKHITSCEVALFKSKVMQIEKTLINDRLGVSNVSWKFQSPTSYDFAVIYPCYLLFF